MRLGVVAAVAVAALALSAPAGAILPERVVRATPSAEGGTTAGRLADGTRVLAWTEWRGRTFRAGLDAYVKIGEAPPLRLNLNGNAVADGVDAPWVAYTVLRGRQTDIRLYNVDTGVRSAPAGVSTPDDEGSATLSGDWILFERQRVEDQGGPTVVDEKVILFNRSTLEERVLDNVGTEVEACCTLRAGQVAGDYAVWHRCGGRECAVFRHTISTDQTVRLLLPAGTRRRQQYAASVTPAGVVYLVRSDRRRGCGEAGLRIVRYFGPGDPATGRVIAARRPGTTASRTFALAGASTGVFLDRERQCSTPIGVVPPSDLTRIVDPG